jgi:predicted MFS family arabinose efflux permease
MSSFGAGSVLGSWLGGRLTDKLGFYDIMVGSLLTSGLAFIGLQYIKGFEPFCLRPHGVVGCLPSRDVRGHPQLCAAG